MKVSVFIPCLIDQFAPETAANTIRILEKVGCTIHYNAALTCCGKPPYEAGHWDESKAVSQKFLRSLPLDTPIVVPGMGCVGMVRNGYNDLFTNTVDHNTCRNIQSNIFELSDFLVNILNIDYFGAEFEARVVYHDACHSGANASHLGDHNEEARILLNKVAGLDLVETRKNLVACGAGAGFPRRFSELASKMAQEQVDVALDVGAEVIVSNDMACVLQLRSYIQHKQLSLRTLHLADVLTQGWPNI